MLVHRGEIYLVNFGETEYIGREQTKNIRPAIIISNDKANTNPNNDLVMVALLSSSMGKMNITHMPVTMETTTLSKPSKIMTEHIRSIDKARLITYKGRLRKDKMAELDDRIQIATGIFDFL